MVTAKTKLQHLMFDADITVAMLRDTIGVKTDKSAREKLDGTRNFTLPEMRAVKRAYFPRLSLEEIFEGYGELEQKGA